MKKAISLILVLMLCLGLCACSGEAEVEPIEPKVVGNWSGESFYGTMELTLNADHTGELIQDDESQAITWLFDEASRLILIEMESMNRQAFTYVEADNSLYHHEISLKRAE